MQSDRWQLHGLCYNMPVNTFFELFEDHPEIRPAVRQMCKLCPVQKVCANVGEVKKEVGVWGGVYWNGKGEPDDELNEV